MKYEKSLCQKKFQSFRNLCFLELLAPEEVPKFQKKREVSGGNKKTWNFLGESDLEKFQARSFRNAFQKLELLVPEEVPKFQAIPLLRKYQDS
ncbi:hypothetical protein LJC46_10025 [Desulfovibrio sp. OttesenSCG-928-G15]|nr:hypothetical protein [Desulfovibrio sp. OttesenSCG-928-G15]